MSRIMRKPVLGVSDQVRHKPGRFSHDQDTDKKIFCLPSNRQKVFPKIEYQTSDFTH